MEDLREAALEYAAMGWAVFPVLPGRKQPACENGFKDASTDAAKINAWWAAMPDANIGFVPESAGLCVVDLDPGADVVSFALPPTYSVRTPRGRHLYFTGSLPPSAGRLGPHIDTRGVGSYVLLAPSRTAQGIYEEEGGELAPVPAWVVSALAKPATPVINEASAEPLDDPAAIVRGKAFLAGQPGLVDGSGSDEATFRYAAQLRDYGISQERCTEMLLEATPDFDVDWIAEKVANAYHYGQNAAGAWAIPPASSTFKIDLQAAASAELRAARARFPRLKPSDGAKLPPIVFWDKLETLPRLPEGCKVMLAGAYGSHKTNVALAMVISAIKAHPETRVLYCAGEDSYGVHKYRIEAQCKAQGISLADLDEAFVLTSACPNLTTGQDIPQLILAYEDFKPHFVVIDTMAVATPGADENSSTDAKAILDNLDVLREAFRATIFPVHHFGKDDSKGTRGSSAFNSGFDVVLYLRYAGGEEPVHMYVEKMKYGKAKFTLDMPTAVFEVGGRDWMTVLPPVISAKPTKAGTDDEEGTALRREVVEALEREGLHTYERGLCARDLATSICGQLYPSNSQEFKDAVFKKEKAISKGLVVSKKTNRAKLDLLHDAHAVNGKLERRFFLMQDTEDAV